jgi:hypothetical protein
MDQREEGVTMSGSQGFQAAYKALGPAGAVATVAGALAVVVVGFSLITFTRGAMTTAPDVASTSDVDRKADTKTIEKYLAQINGRSLVIRPGQVAQKDPEPPAPPPGPPLPPPPPSSYEGSKIIAMVLDTVWFEDGRKMKVGDAEKDDTEVVSVNAPWDAKLRWKKVEFTVPLFGRDTVVLKKKDESTTVAAPATTPDPAPAADPPAETKTASPGDKPAEKPPEKPADPPKPGGERIATGDSASPPAEKTVPEKSAAEKTEPAKESQPPAPAPAPK